MEQKNQEQAGSVSVSDRQAERGENVVVSDGAGEGEGIHLQLQNEGGSGSQQPMGEQSQAPVSSGLFGASSSGVNLSSTFARPCSLGALESVGTATGAAGYSGGFGQV